MTPSGRPAGQADSRNASSAATNSARPGSTRVGARPRHLEERTPAVERERIGAAERKIPPRLMHLGQRLPDRGAVMRLRPAHPHPFEKRDDRGGPPGDAGEAPFRRGP